MTTTTLEYISKNDLAKSLGISIATIDRKLKEIPHVKMGNARQSRVLGVLKHKKPSKERL